MGFLSGALKTLFIFILQICTLALDMYGYVRYAHFLLQFTSKIDWKLHWGLASRFFIHYLIAKGTKKKDDPSAARKGGGGRTSSCNTKSKQDKPTRTSTKIKGVSCSGGQLCKNFRGLKLHQIKAKCQASENKLTSPDKRCFCVID